VDVIAAPWLAEPDAVAAALGTDPTRGLTAAEAARRLVEHGPNELHSEPPVPMWRRILAQFRDPLVVLLLVAVVVSVAAWVVEGAEGLPFDALVIAVIVVANAVLGVVQERKAEDAVAALQQISAPTASVVRDGGQERVPARDVVPGDVLVLAEGDTVPADARLFQVSSLHVAEAALTGESEAVTKTTATLRGPTALGDRTCMVFGGTAATRGSGRALVVATGMTAETGKIAQLLSDTEQEPTPLQREIAGVGRMLGIAVVAIAVVVVATVMAVSDLRTLSDWVTVLLLGVSLAVAAVPEGLPAVLSVVLAIGVQRMAARNAIVKNLSSVETLGSASVICSDKTGTLTQNEMTLVRVVTASGVATLDGVGYTPVGEVRAVEGERGADGELDQGSALWAEVAAVLSGGSAANDAVLRQGPTGDWIVQGDPTDAAFLVAERKLGTHEERLGRYRRVAAVPFTSERKLMSTVEAVGGPGGRFVGPGGAAVGPGGAVGGPGGAAGTEHGEPGDETWGEPGDETWGERWAEQSDARGLTVMTKGAPDVLLGRCTQVLVGREAVPMTDDRRRAVLAAVEAMSDDALRTLGVAWRRTELAPDAVLDVDGDILEAELERELVWCGVVGIIDPARPEAAAAVAAAHRAGVRIMMITGDHPRTALRIATDLGIVQPGARAATGLELDELDEAGWRDVVRTTSVFARVSPEHKLTIVDALQADGLVVAMTGDGVNDAPALKSADIGVAMGITGTEVTRQAGAMILADDNFATIVAAVREGRGIFENIKKFLRYLLSSNMGEVLTVFLGVVFAGALGLTGHGEVVVVPLLATQILWINLLTDTGPALAMGVDPQTDDVMARPPRRLTDRVIDARMWRDVLVIGFVMAVVSLFAIDIHLPGGLVEGSDGVGLARTTAFTVLVLAQLFNAFNARSGLTTAFRRTHNRWLWGAVALAFVLQVAVVNLPFLNAAFGTEPLRWDQWLVCLALASVVLWVEEVRKLVLRAGERRRAD
jgi:magnesium-transporting ATPase (P-type)